MKIAGREGIAALGILVATFALSAFIGWNVTSRRQRHPADRENSGLHMWLGDTVYFGESEMSTVAEALTHLEKPAVVFAFRQACSMCLTEFDLVEAAARKSGMHVWMLVVTDSTQSWEPPARVINRLDMRPARITRASADEWGIRDTPAIIELGLGNRLLFFRQGAGAPMEVKAIMWRPVDPASPVGQTVDSPGTALPVRVDR